MTDEPTNDQSIPVPLFTKLGIIGVPMIPTVLIDAIAGGGIAPPVLVGFALSYLAWECSPKVLSALGKNEGFLSYLAAHPEHLGKLDRLCGHHFSKQISHLGVSVTQPKEGSAALPQEVVEESRSEQQEAVMEPLQPAPTREAVNPDAVTEESRPGLSKAAPPLSVRQSAIIGPDPALRLDLAPNFQPDANDPLKTGVLAVGCSGSGKTVALVRFVEQYIKRYGLGCVIFDSQGDWKSLIEDGFCPRGILATPENMPSMAEVVAGRLQVVVDLDEWHEAESVGMNWEMAARLIAQSIRDLMAVQKRLTLEERIPCLVALDEVHLWVPQDLPSYLSQSTARTLLDTVTRLSTTGRKLGVVPFFATQRIAKVNKDVIGSMETRLFGKADLDNDLTRYREYIDQSVVTNAQIRAFRPGEMVVCFNGERILAQFHHRESRHTSHTPRVPMGTAHKTRPGMPASTGSRYHRHGAGDASWRRREREMRLHGIQVRETVREPGAVQVPLPATYQKEEQPLPTLEEVLAAFPEHKPSKRDIQKHFGITNHQAYKLYQQLDQLIGRSDQPS